MNVGSIIQFCNGVSTPILNFDFPLGGERGVITELSCDGITVRLAKHFPELDEWSNAILWQWVDCFEHLDLDSADYTQEERLHMFLGWLSARVCAEWGLSETEPPSKDSDAALRKLQTLPSAAVLVELGLWHDDVDSAALAVQAALGVTDGGLASIMLGDDWRDDFEGYVNAELRNVREELEDKL